MDPLSIGIGIVGLGMSIFGGLSQSSNARQQAAVSSDIAQQEQGINSQKQMQQSLDAQRMQLENFRNAQRQRSLATAAAVNQGSSSGAGLKSSGLQGGLAGVTDMAAFNSRSITQNSQIANNIFGLTSNISSDKMKLASLGGQAATDQGIMSLGGALIKSGPTIGALGQNIFGSSSSSSGGFNPFNVTGSLY